jgi:hypothetical protein
MIAGQTMRARDGYQVALFPLPYMYISQGEMMSSNYSHYNTYNMDFLGWDANGRVYNCPLYAPCDLVVISLWDYTGSHTVTFQSLEPVHFADGNRDFLTIAFTHANNPPYFTIGDRVSQGQLIYYTGIYGNSVTGDHVHMTAGRGVFAGYTQRTGGHYDLTNRWHLYDTLYINDTVIVYDSHSYNWREFTAPTTPPTGKRESRFPWVLYARKLRDKNVS